MQEVWKTESDQTTDRERLPDSVLSADYDYHSPAPSKVVLTKSRGLLDRDHF